MTPTIWWCRRAAKVVQIALQKEPEFPGQKRYTINKDLWDRMDDVGKAGLIFDEILYTVALEAGAKDSVGVRYSMPDLLGRITGTPIAEFIEIARKVPLSFVEFQGHEFRVDEENPRAYGDFATFAGGPLYSNAEEVSVQGKDTAASELLYDRDGQIKDVVLYRPDTFEFAGNPLEFTGGVRLDPQGRIVRGVVSGHSIFDFESDSYSLTPDPRAGSQPNPDFYVSINPQGQLVECGACKGFVTVNGRKISVRSEVSTDPKHHFAESFDFFGFVMQAIGEPDPGAAELYLAENTTLPVGGQDIVFYDRLTFWDAAGTQVYRGNVRDGTAIGLHGMPALFVGPAVFTPEGALSEGILAADSTLVDAQGQNHLYPKTAHLTFDGAGAVIKAEFP